MTAKYHTSKLRQFEDLQGVETFGFRGEALSSLCALSNMIIITRHSSSEAGLRIELDNEGEIKNKTICARQIGTTVILANLFSTLPVRKREFTKNIKREFSKMCSILQSYCMVATNVRIVCTNINAKGAKTTIMSTNGSSKILENIQAIFGAKQVSELMEMKSPFPETGKLTKDDLNVSGFDDTKVNEDELEMLNMAKFQMQAGACSTAALPPSVLAASKLVPRTVMTLTGSFDFKVKTALPANWGDIQFGSYAWQYVLSESCGTSQNMGELELCLSSKDQWSQGFSSETLEGLIFSNQDL
uniref:DNA mismatch repair protein S5 domain-containing protein n=1 Tax=Megaselia scalaris TaxID=36166 RepID=T1H129_MEGSC